MRKDNITLLPASLLPHEKSWKTFAQKLPDGSCLLIWSEGNIRVGQSLRKAAAVFEAQGRNVVFLKQSPPATN